MSNFDSDTLCLTLTELYKNYYNITSLLLTLKGPKGPTLGHFPSHGGPSPKSATAAKSREIPRKFELIAAQGHPRSPTLVPIESAYTTSYFLLVINSKFGRISYRFRDIHADER